MLHSQNQQNSWVHTFVDSYPNISFGFGIHWHGGRSHTTLLQATAAAHFAPDGPPGEQARALARVALAPPFPMPMYLLTEPGSGLVISVRLRDGCGHCPNGWICLRERVLPQPRFEALPESYAGSKDGDVESGTVGIKAEALSSSSATARGAAVGR